MMKQTFHNQLHSKYQFSFSGPQGFPPNTVGFKFQELTLEPEVGPEVAAMWVDPTPFAVELHNKKPFELRLNSGAVRTSAGNVMFVLWWVPPIQDGKPFAMCEQLLNPASARTVEGLRRASQQTHFHVVLVGPSEEILGLYEFENTFEFDNLTSLAEAIGPGCPTVDFAAARQEYERSYDMMDLFQRTLPPFFKEYEAKG
jgi:hypothetical protein